MAESYESWISELNEHPTALLRVLRISFVEADADHLVAELVRTDESSLPEGFFNGGVIELLISITAGRFANLSLAPPGEPQPEGSHGTVTIQENVNFVGNSRASKAIAEARHIRKARAHQVIQTVVHDTDGRLLASATTTSQSL